MSVTMSEELLQHDTEPIKHYKDLSNPYNIFKKDYTLGNFKKDFSKDDVRLYYPLQLWCWVKGNDSWTRRQPVEPLHRDPKIWNQLNEEQKETFDILDTRNLGMPTQAQIAAGMHVAERCDKENALYTLAKSEFQDPRSALRAGKALSDCVEGSFQFILDRCPNAFKDYARAIENNEYTVERTRFEQYRFDMCMHKNGQEKARMSYRETVIEDQEVPWEKPLNPHNFKVYPVDNLKHAYDPLRNLGVAPTNDAFKDFVQRTKASRGEPE